MSKVTPNRTDGIRITIDTEDPVQRWRFRCPQGHTQWEPTNFHWWCAECARNHQQIDPEFTKLVDKKTGKVYARDEVLIEGYRSKTQ